mmetsp:Transcript_8640/g.1195  ORF Transcript_8640/g.1195 Transcript_8640/m.1195 type:complete len:89 (-) Transcript_8640:1318-1584(-)
MGCPSKQSQYVIFLPDPVVISWDSSGWYSTCLNIVDSNKQVSLVKFLMSHTMQEPSELAETACSLLLRICIAHTLPRCSFNEASIVWV